VVSLAEELRVPPRAQRVDASLGDDPNRARAVQAWLPEGEWHLVVMVGSQRVACAIQADASWVIVHTSPSGMQAYASAGRVVLD
jgi:hypothetical protein